MTTAMTAQSCQATPESYACTTVVLELELMHEGALTDHGLAQAALFACADALQRAGLAVHAEPIAGAGSAPGWSAEGK